MGSDRQTVLFEIETSPLAPKLSAGAREKQTAFGLLLTFESLHHQHPIPLFQRDSRAMESTEWKTTSWHEVPWEPGRNYRMMCQNPGNEWSLLCLWHKRIYLNSSPGP